MAAADVPGAPDVPPARSSSKPAWRISVVASAILLIELALIRLIPAEVRVISYFTNLVLVATFFGLGLGAILHARVRLDWTLPLGLGLLVAFVAFGRGLVIYEEAESVHYWLQHGHAEGLARRVPLLPAAISAFLLSALPFVALGQALVRAMDEHPRLVAYSWDILGSLAGTLLFALGSWLRLPPWAWPVAVMAVWTAVFERRPLRVAAHLAAGAAFLLFSQGPLPGRWSPYYLVQHEADRGGLRVFVNSSFHQYAIDWRDTDDPDLRGLQEHMLAKFGEPYATYRALHGGRAPRRVLVLGAGTGNDVAVALRLGAEEVVAVEIDPVILELGRDRNPSRPYASDRVRAVTDDARHFLRTTEEHFDLIVFGTLDSQTLLSGQANLRLENYVYTAESFADARARLAPGGVVAIYYSVFREWLYPRLMATVRRAFGDHCRLSLWHDRMLFNATVICAPDAAAFVDTPAAIAVWDAALPSVDDWPYLYVREPTIAPIYLALFAVVGGLIAGVLAILRRLHPVRGQGTSFLLLGVGFTLMEAAAIVRLALVLGSTWTVHVLVFSTVLLTIFLANLLVIRRWAPPLGAAWVGLTGSLLLNYAVPLQSILAATTPVRELSAGLLVALPVFFAAVAFSRLFERERTTGYALGINLVGAMAGGLLEYVSMRIGMRDVWLVALVIYLGAWWASARARPPVAVPA